jgi:hypothetical protein
VSALAAPIEPSSTARSRDRSELLDGSRLAFIGLLVLGAVIVFVETRGTFFFGDDWDFIVNRRGVTTSTLLTPHGPHLSLIPVLIYKVILKVFGDGYLPFRVLAAVDLVVMAVALGIACRTRWGRWWGLVPVLLLVTLGPGSITLLWPFQVGYAISTAIGVLALLALTRHTRRSDLLACLALVVSLASASQGIGFLVGAVIVVGLTGDWRTRAWTWLVPGVLYGAWYLGYGHQASETHLSLWGTCLPYVVDALGTTLGGLSGLSSVDTGTGVLDLTFGVPLAVVLLGAIVYALSRGWRPSPVVWAIAATLVILWIAAALSNPGDRPPNEPRYLPPDALLLLVAFCDALPRPRLAGRALIGVLGLLAIVAATNANQYSQTRAFMHTSAVSAESEIGAMNIMRGVASPAFAPYAPGDPGILVHVTARNLFSAEDAFGVMGDSPTQLFGEKLPIRQHVDQLLGAGELHLTVSRRTPGPFTGAPTWLSGSARARGGCLVLGAGPVGVRTPPGRYALVTTASTPISTAMARFSSTYSYVTGTVPAGSIGIVSVPADRAQGIPWRLLMIGQGGRVCRVGG